MEVIIKKSQSKGMMGGVSFKVKATANLTEEERNLVKHYNIGSAILLSRKRKNIWGELTNDEVKISANSFIIGEEFSCKSLDEILSYEESIKEAAKNLKAYLDVAKNFDGEERISL